MFHFGSADGFRNCEFPTEADRTIGPEPDGARLRIRRSEPDLGSYLEVVVEYDDENIVARAYAIRCDREAPTRWE